MDKLEAHQIARQIAPDSHLVAQLYRQDPPLLEAERDTRVITDAGRASLRTTPAGRVSASCGVSPRDRAPPRPPWPVAPSRHVARGRPLPPGSRSIVAAAAPGQSGVEEGEPAPFLHQADLGDERLPIGAGRRRLTSSRKSS